MKKILASVLTLFVFCAAVPFTVLAAVPVNGDLTVDGVAVLTDGALGTISGTGWEYDETTNTLYLDGYNGAGIVVNEMEDFTIYLSGDNVISQVGGRLSAISCYGSLTLTGDAGATLLANTLNSDYTAIYVETDLIIDGGVFVTVEETGYFGIGVDGSLTIKGGSTVSAVSVDDLSSAAAIGGAGNIFILENSTVYAYGLNAHSYGIAGMWNGASIVIENSTVYAEAVTPSRAIYANGDITANSGTVVTPGGINADGSVIINGGSIVASSITPTPVNGDGTELLRTDIVLDGAGANALITAINDEAVEGYGLDSVYTQDDGSISLWLPAGVTITSIEADGVVYEGTVEAGGSATFSEAEEEPVPTPTPDPEPTPTPDPVTPSPETGDNSPQALLWVTGISLLALAVVRKKRSE